MMAHHRSSNGMFLIPWVLASNRTLWEVKWCEHFFSHLLFKISFISTPFPSLFDSGMWERAAPALRSTPVRWVLTTIKFHLSVVRLQFIAHLLPHFFWCLLIPNHTRIAFFTDKYSHSCIKITTLHVELGSIGVASVIEGVAFVDSVLCVSSWLLPTP